MKKEYLLFNKNENMKEIKPVHYHEYLQLDKILNAQDLESSKYGKPAHEETLFIIIHQVYELWFKQIIHELDSLIDAFNTDNVDEKSIGVVVARLNRVIEIQKILIDQLKVLETMTPLDFLEFRNYLVPASGFQSFQFRQVEVKLGLPQEKRLKYNKHAYHKSLTPSQEKEILELEKQDSVFDLLEKWLERTPFLESKNFNFLEAYKNVTDSILESEKEAMDKSIVIGEQNKEVRDYMLKETKACFDSITDKKMHDELVAKGERRLSHKATAAALFINLYRDQPVLHLPYQFMSALVDIDELFTTWRYNHALMVMRMIGKKVGTGGSAGHDYLRKTSVQHKIFTDLNNITTLLVPRSVLPELPGDFVKELGFYFTAMK